MDILNYINKMQKMYGDQASLADDLEPGALKDELLKDFDPSQETYEEYLQRKSLERPFNMAQGGSAGQLVTPSVDGSRPGYAGDPVEANIRLTPTGNAYEVAVQRGPQVFNKTFRKENYKNASEALKAARKFRDQKKKIPFKVGIQDPIYGSGLSRKEYQKIYREETRELTDVGKLAKERETKLKNFIGKKKKIKASVLRNFMLNKLGYENFAAYKVKQKFPNLEIIKDIKQGADFKPLNKKEITIIKNNFDLPEGVKDWNFKQHKFGFSSDKHPRLYAQIKSRLGDKQKYTIAANFNEPQGWMMGSMNRVYENETILKDGKRVLKKGVKKLTYEPIKNKKGIIVGFKDNTAAGDGKIYYGTKKAAKNYGDGTEWRAHGDFNRVKKFLKIANGVKAKPDKLLQKILDKKGITQILGGKGYLTLNDILSHERYYSTLAETSPKALIKRQIVLHHTKGVGDQNLLRAAATKDIQLLTDAVNTKVIELENIVKGTKKNPARKLKADEIAQLKNYGAKIVDFDGKVVGGGFIDPEKQFAEIEKRALKYAKGKDFNVKTVTSYLERLGCGNSAGGRILMFSGGSTLTKCAQKGINKFNQNIKTGNANSALMRTILANGGNILRSVGKQLNPAELLKLRNLIGPQALGFFAAYEAGVITDDVLRKGTPLNEALSKNWLTKSFMPYNEQAAKAKNLLRSGKLETDAQKVYALDLMKYDQAIKKQEKLEQMKFDQGLGYGKDESGITNEMIDSAEKDLNRRIEDLSSRNVLTRGSAIGQEYQALEDEMVASRPEKFKYFFQGDKGTPLVNRLAKPARTRGGKGANRGIKIDYSLPTYDRMETPTDQDILNTFRQYGVISPTEFKTGVLQPGEGTLIRMMQGGQGLYGTQFATGGMVGDKSGPPPTGGPMSQGLRSLYNNGKKL